MIHRDQVRFIPGVQGGFNIYQPINVRPHQQNEGQKPDNHVKRCKKKATQRTQHPFLTKILNRIEMVRIAQHKRVEWWFPEAGKSKGGRDWRMLIKA